MRASRLKTEAAEEEGQREDGLCVFDRAEDAHLGRTFKASLEGRTKPRGAQQGGQETNDGGENLGSAIHSGKGTEEGLTILLEKSMVRTGRRPRRCQVKTVERGMPTCRGRDLAPERTTCSRRRWS